MHISTILDKSHWRTLLLPRASNAPMKLLQKKVVVEEENNKKWEWIKVKNPEWAEREKKIEINPCVYSTIHKTKIGMYESGSERKKIPYFWYMMLGAWEFVFESVSANSDFAVIFSYLLFCCVVAYIQRNPVYIYIHQLIKMVGWNVSTERKNSHREWKIQPFPTIIKKQKLNPKKM